MAGYVGYFTEADAVYWGAELSTWWTIDTWKEVLGYSAFILLWLYLTYVFLLMLFTCNLRLLVPSYILSLIGGYAAQIALFNPTPYGYVAWKLLGKEGFHSTAIWFNEHCSIMGFLFS